LVKKTEGILGVNEAFFIPIEVADELPKFYCIYRSRAGFLSKISYLCFSYPLSPNIAHNSVINTSKLSSILEFISNNSTNHDNAMLVRRVPINPTFAKSLGS
jgi:hypothetical protein